MTFPDQVAKYGVTVTNRRGQDVMKEAQVLHGERLLGFFSYGHLPAKLGEVSAIYADAALRTVEKVASSPERTVALRKLLEAKDCAVRAALALVLLLLAAVPAAAQTPGTTNPPSVVPARAFTVEADHDGVETIGYRVKIDGVQVGGDLPLSARNANGVVSHTMENGVAAGDHVLQVCAFNAGGEACASLVFVARVAPPKAPTNPRVRMVQFLQIVTASGDSVRARIELEEDPAAP